MKNLILILFLLISSISITACDSDESNTEEESLTEWKCGFHNGKQLWTGPRGGCYYYNSNNNKTYVDRSECNC